MIKNDYIFPPEVYVVIFSYLNETDLLNINFTCRYFKEIEETFLQKRTPLLRRAISCQLQEIEKVKSLIQSGAFLGAAVGELMDPERPFFHGTLYANDDPDSAKFLYPPTEVVHYLRLHRLNKLYEEAETYFANHEAKEKYTGIVRKVCEEGERNSVTISDDIFHPLEEKALLSFTLLESFFQKIAVDKYRWKVNFEVS